MPRKLVGRYPKWTRNYQGPYLVVREIPPCDYQIQRNRRSVPITVHGDKLKLCYSDTPPAWIQPEVTSTIVVDSPADRQSQLNNDSIPVECPQYVSENRRPALGGTRRPRRRRDYQRRS